MVLALVLLLVVLAAVVVTLALRRTCASLDIRAQEEVAFMLEDMDSWRRGPPVRNFLRLYLELLGTFLISSAVQAKEAFMPEDMDSWRRGTAACNSRLHTSDASRMV